MTDKITTEQVKETLEFLLNMCDADTCLQGGKGKCENCHHAVDVAIEALEKQEQRKPVIFGQTTKYYACPRCDEAVQIGFPCRCGQMIDWSDR